MNNSLMLTKKILKTKAFAVVLTVLSAVVLPQIFHIIGIVSKTGAVPGEVFLPMHLPVLAAGLLAGPAVGAVAGALSPIISFALTGMPSAAMLPFMLAELAAYGLVAGALRNVKLPTLAKLISAQLAGRALRALIILFSVYVLGYEAVTVPVIFASVIKGLPGLMLQWALIPLFVFWVNNHECV